MIFSRAAGSALSEFRANPRLRWGTWAILAILWLYGNLLLSDLADARAEEYRALSNRIARVQATAAQTEWLSRVESGRSLQLDAESRLWRASTAGLAQAAFQDWLNQSVQQADVTRAQVTVGAAEEATVSQASAAAAAPVSPTPSGLWKVSARLGFDFNPKSFYALMSRIAEHDKHTVVESLTVRGAPTPRVETVLVAYFQKPGQ